MSDELIQPGVEVSSQDAALGKRKPGRPIKGINPVTGKPFKKSKAEREAHARSERESYARKTEQRQVLGSGTYNNPEALKREEIVKFLAEESGMSNEHVIATVADLIEVSARLNKLTANRFFILNGEVQAQASIEAGKELFLEEASQEKARGEVITQRDLQMIYVHSVGWRDFDGRKISFSEFCEMRFNGKVDAYYLGKEILGKDWHALHKSWADEFYIKRNPDLLPMNYSQADLRKAVAAQDTECRRRLLLAMRNGYKSTFQVIDLVGFALCFIEAPILLVSSVASLSEGFIRSFRSYFLVKSYNTPTLFNALFPEYCVDATASGSSKEFRSPMSRLDLIQPTATSTSLDSKVAGERCMVLALDDIIDNFTSSTEDVREKTLEKFDLLVELLEPTGYLQAVGTPYCTGDLYQTICDRAEKAGAKPWHIRFDPAWIVKPEARHKKFPETEDDVELTFPERLTFADLMSSAQENLINFRRQKLVEWADDTDNDQKLNFDIDALNARVIRDSLQVPSGGVALLCDRAYTTSRYSDLSSIAAVRVAKNAEGILSLYILEVQADRWRASELAQKIAELAKKYATSPGGLDSIHIEKGGDQQMMGELITGALRNQSVFCGITWRPPLQHKSAKWTKFKSLEGLLYTGRLFFAADPCWKTDVLFNQMLGLDGKGPNSKSSASRKDDCVDSVSMGLVFLKEAPTDDESKFIEAQRQKALIGKMHEHIFGSPYTPPPQKSEPEPSGRGIFGIPGLRQPGNTGPAPVTHAGGWGSLHNRKS